MLKTLFNKLRWDETMVVAAFAEAGDFRMMEQAVKKEKTGCANRRTVRKPERKSVRSVLVHEN
jgi:hypothetical protein